MKVQKEVVREANEKNILEAAEQVFAISGFKGATTEQIAKLAGIPKANLHYYFKTKTLLYCQVLEGILEEWMIASESFDKYQEPGDALQHYVESKMIFSRKRPDASKIWANEVLHGASNVNEFLETTLTSWLENRIATIDGWIKAGKMNVVDPYVFMNMIWSMTQHYADFERQLVILNHGKQFTDEEYQEKTQQVVKLILTSIGIEPKYLH